MSISRAEFAQAATDDEGFRMAFAQCRACSMQVLVCVDWCELQDEPMVVSSGCRPGCNNMKCGDKMPAHIDRMATEGDLAFWQAKHAFYRIMDTSLNYDAGMQAISDCDTVGEARAAAEATASLYRIVVEGAK
jgi:hypothetical protein